MRRRDNLIGTTLLSVLAALCLLVSPLARAVSIDDWLSETHDGMLTRQTWGSVLSRTIRLSRPAS